MHWGNGRDIGGPDGDCKNLLSSPCIVNHRAHPCRLPGSQSSSRRRKVPKSKPCLQHQSTCSCTCRRPICKPHLISQPISFSSDKGSGTASLLLLPKQCQYITCQCILTCTLCCLLRCRLLCAVAL